MDIALILLLLIVGFVLIIKGGDYFVDGASWLAEVSGIPKFIVGATIVSVATTLPEIIVSLISASSQPDMAIGNAVGSVVFNSGVIMSIALIASPFVIKRKDYAFKSLLLVGTMAILFAFSFQGVNLSTLSWNTQGTFGYVGSVVLLLIFLTFIIENVKSAKEHALMDRESESEKPNKDKKSVLINLLKLILGAGAIALGAILLKDNAVKLAELAGVPGSVIGVTILAIGTSLPELVTMLIAVKKGQASLSVGNIVGANTIDLALILPLSAFIAGGNGVPVSNMHLLVTMPVTLLILGLSLIPTLISKKFARWQGITMIAIYSLYFAFNIVYAVI